MRAPLLAGLIALTAGLGATAVQAQAADPHAGHAMPAAAPAAAKLTTDAPIAALMANPAAKAVVNKEIPDLEAHPAYAMISGMSLKAVAPMSEGRITDEVLTRLDAELAKLPAA